MKPWLVIFILLVGMSLGIGGTIFGPEVAAPYLPEAFQVKKSENVTGEVMRKLREGNRVLLTVQTSQGTVLATFKKKVAEIDLLVQQGDVLTLALSRYEPFVEDPAIERVRKQDAAPTLKGNAAGEPPFSSE